jgi:hypothetical protein
LIIERGEGVAWKPTPFNRGGLQNFPGGKIEEKVLVKSGLKVNKGKPIVTNRNKEQVKRRIK